MNLVDFFICVFFIKETVTTKYVAMIAGEDHHGFIRQTQFIKPHKQSTNLRIHPRSVIVTIADEILPFGPSFGKLFVEAIDQAWLTARFTNVIISLI